MKLYDKMFNIVKGFSKNLLKDPATNVGVSSNIAAELTLLISLLIICLLLRHLNMLFSAILVLVIGTILTVNMPVIPKFKIEQDDSLNKMLFYMIITLGILVTFIYWGGNFV